MQSAIMGTIAGLLLGAAGDTMLKGRLMVLDGYDVPTPGVASGAGDLYVESDIEADGAFDLAGDVSLAGGAGAITLTDSASSIVIPNNDASALDIGGSGLTTLLRVSTVTDAQQVIANAGLRSEGGSITAVTSLDASDCGRSFGVTAGIDTATITLPDADQVLGCALTFSYVGADGGALVDISPLDSDADGIEGGCYETATDTVVYFSGTADADIGLTKATALTGDYISMFACGAAMWCVTGCQGIWANN